MSCTSNEKPKSLFNVEQYFNRIGFEYTPGVKVTPDLETLTRITRRHTASLPFENIDAFLDETVSAELDGIFEKIVVSKRGGYCFEQNPLLLGVLEHLGFDVFLMLCRSYFPFPDAVPSRSHCVVHVAFPDGSAYLVDVGGGMGTTTTPLQLRRAGSTSVDPYVDMCGVEQWTDNAKHVFLKQPVNYDEEVLIDADGNKSRLRIMTEKNSLPYSAPLHQHSHPVLQTLNQTYGKYLWQPLRNSWRLACTFDLQKVPVSDVVMANFYVYALTFKGLILMHHIVEKPKTAEESMKAAGSGPLEIQYELTMLNNQFGRYTAGMKECLEKRTLTSIEEIYDVIKNEFQQNVDDPKHGISLEKLRSKSDILLQDLPVEEEKKLEE